MKFFKNRPVKIIRIASNKKTRSIILAVACFLIIIGVYIILRPWYLAWRFDKTQKSMLDTWAISSVFNADTRRAGWQRSIAVVGGDAVNEVWEEDTNPRIDAYYVVNNMDGVLTINKIGLTAPIISKYTIANLDISICSIIEKNKMGQVGNYVLAGHKSRIRGRHFSRLIEVTVGDLVVTENKVAKYTYQVTDVYTVTPSDVWVMENDGDEKIITLITCDYRTDPIGRLIVRGKLIDSEPAAATN